MVAGEDRVFTLAQVSEHCTDTDCWLIIGGKVYDVTEFLEDHPGGGQILVTNTGKDATDDFEDIGHSASAKEKMKQYYVGKIDSSTITGKKAYTPSKQRHADQDKTVIVKILQLIAPLIILGLAFGVYSYLKST